MYKMDGARGGGCPPPPTNCLMNLNVLTGHLLPRMLFLENQNENIVVDQITEGEVAEPRIFQIIEGEEAEPRVY